MLGAVGIDYLPRFLVIQQGRFTAHRVLNALNERIIINIDFLGFEIVANIHAEGIADFFFLVFQLCFIRCLRNAQQAAHG